MFLRLFCRSLLSLQLSEFALFYINLSSRHSSSREFKQTPEKFRQMLCDPGLTLLRNHTPPLQFELIPLYSTCRLSSSLAFSLPTLRVRVIQPEQYVTGSWRRCSSAPLFSPNFPPAVFVRNTVWQLPWERHRLIFLLSLFL